MADLRILIIGAGIGGSTLAYALRRAGFAPLVAEARAEHAIGEGAFLTLAPNGSTVLRALGLGEVPDAAGGFEQFGIDFCNAGGRRIASVRGEDDRDRYGATSTVLLRSALRAELEQRARAAGAEFRFGARLVALDVGPEGCRARFADGSEVVADAVIGADGIRSTVRRLVWPGAPAPRYTGIVDCGGVAAVPLPDTHRQQMTFGHRAFFGSAVHAGRAYWFTNLPVEQEPSREELRDPDQDALLATIRQLHERDPEPVRAVLRAAGSVLGAWPVAELPPLAAWHTDRVCLLGDAAHAVSPSSGQGASLAIEDAEALARQLRTAASPAEAFGAFEAERKDRAEAIVRFGRQIGDRKISPVTSRFRDLTLRLFLRLGARATRAQYRYRPPPPARPEGSAD